MENPLKVQAKINELNLAEPRINGPLGSFIPGIPANNWGSVPGYFALTGFNNGVFNPSYGYIVKIFVNNQTGEIKTYPYQFFEG